MVDAGRIVGGYIWAIVRDRDWELDYPELRSA